MIREAIQLLVDRNDLPFELAQQSMREIMAGEATPSQIGAFLTSLRMKGETIDEITALAMVMRENAVRINPQVNGRTVDTCGTGGDRLKTFNVSTGAALVAAGAGVPIAKHGNRSVTSKCGSAGRSGSGWSQPKRTTISGPEIDRASRNRVHVCACIPPSNEKRNRAT